jgi:Protein of unknown function (DUF2924)
MLNVGKEVAALQRLTTKELRDRYAELFGEQTHANNKAWLVKRLAWRLQARAEGGLSERALRRAAELADDADLRLSPPRPQLPMAAPGHTASAPFKNSADYRLPLPGTTINRAYKNKNLQVHVLQQGFEFEGAVYKSLSAVAKAITGSHCSGYLFFGLTQQGGAQ